MRLTDAQVKNAILSPDQDVRGAAVFYFSQAYSPDSAIIPLAIQAVEQYGWKDAFESYSFMSKLPQTDETTLWLIAQIKNTAVSVFENIHSDLSVETCLNFFETEQDHRIRCRLLQSVLMNFATEGIEPARQLILITPLDPQVLEVRSDLLTACKVMGESFPELDAWTEDSKNDVEFRKNWYRKKLLNLDDFELADEEIDEPPPEPLIRHAQVGRNDPCPCGSGKKFKKCCLGKQELPDNRSLGSATDQLPQYPVGTVALYGPDDKVTTKIVAGVIRRPGAEPVLERWVGTNVARRRCFSIAASGVRRSHSRANAPGRDDSNVLGLGPIGFGPGRHYAASEPPLY